MNKEGAVNKFHSHAWVVGILGTISGLMLMIYVPSLENVSISLLLFAGFHLAGGVIVLGSLHVLAGRGGVRRWFAWRSRPGEAAATEFDFGWAPAWTSGPWLAAFAVAGMAVAVMVAAPAWWAASLALIVIATGFFAGGLFTRSSARHDHAFLPSVDLLADETGVVLDAGCGAGRTSIALGRALRHGRIVALDRFDSPYIEGGGRLLLDRNLRLAGLADRVCVEPGDMTALPFADATFDAAVSAHALDHLGPLKERGFRELRRVLKPGGRLLFVAWVPGWAMFGVANILSLFLTTRQGWLRMARGTGFEVADQGWFGGVWFLLLIRPEA